MVHGNPKPSCSQRSLTTINYMGTWRFEQGQQNTAGWDACESKCSGNWTTHYRLQDMELQLILIGWRDEQVRDAKWASKPYP